MPCVRGAARRGRRASRRSGPLWPIGGAPRLPWLSRPSRPGGSFERPGRGRSSGTRSARARP
eukprot:5649786-Alexandrium_andersonii.AAC.1